MLYDLNVYVIGRLLLAAVLGGIVGIERELSQKPAGIRTNMLICLGAALFATVSYEMASAFGGDHTRIAAQIIPGIGFIGAGVVIRERGTVIGITSAATIFVVASIGMAVGSGLYVTGIFTALLLLASLIFIGKLEKRLGLHLELVGFRVTAIDGDTIERVRRIVHEIGIRTRIWNTRKTDEGLLLEFEAELTVPQQRELLKRIAELNVKCESRPIRPVAAL
ncbi:MAG TPA: MgtC/SapB family protein [Candidatus Polarisedimenticolia bacterium]|nr:MgtC/SapB family protein [Candidatus Polarisedimenticolia bacterium]